MNQHLAGIIRAYFREMPRLAYPPPPLKLPLRERKLDDPKVPPLELDREMELLDLKAPDVRCVCW